MKHKKIKIFCLVNVLTSVNSMVYHNHIDMWRWTAKNLPWIELHFFTPSRMAIDQARNTAARIAMESSCDYLMFLDDDVMVPVNAVQRLLKANKDITCGLVIIRGYPFNVMAFKYGPKIKGHKALNFYNNLPKEKNGNLVELVECDAVGFSLALIKVSMLQKMEPPYFVTGTGHTEDVYFCMNAKEQLKKVTIFMDTVLECGHLMNAEPVQWKIRKQLKRFYFKNLIQKIPVPQRDEQYIKRALSVVK